MNYGVKQFNYENVVSFKDVLISNRNKMEDSFGKYQGELNRLDSNWEGMSGNVSKEEMSRLFTQYNGFLSKVNDFITVLSDSEESFATTENQNVSRYNV